MSSTPIASRRTEASDAVSASTVEAQTAPGIIEQTQAARLQALAEAGDRAAHRLAAGIFDDDNLAAERAQNRAERAYIVHGIRKRFTLVSGIADKKRAPALGGEARVMAAPDESVDKRQQDGAEGEPSHDFRP